jgi:hypothetical protein
MDQSVEAPWRHKVLHDVDRIISMSLKPWSIEPCSSQRKPDFHQCPLRSDWRCVLPGSDRRLPSLGPKDKGVCTGQSGAEFAIREPVTSRPYLGRAFNLHEVKVKRSLAALDYELSKSPYACMPGCNLLDLKKWTVSIL